MSLPALLRYVYNHGTEEVIRRGKRIFHTTGVQMLDVDHLLEQVRFRVRNDIYQNYYTVTVNKYLDPKNVSVRCQCPYNLGEICRHEVAALFQLNDIIQSGYFENTDISYNQQHTTVRMRQVTPQMIKVFTHADSFERAEALAGRNAAIITSDKADRIEAEVPDGENTYKVIIRQNEERYYDTSCGCAETSHPLCVHKATLYLQVLKRHGSHFFNSLRNWDEQKNKLLQQYGYTVNDDLTGKFTFTYENGKPFLRVLDPSIKKVTVHEKPVPSYRQATARHEVQETVTIADSGKRLGIVLDTHAGWYPFVNIMLVAGETDEDNTKFINGITKLELNQYVNALSFPESERELLPVIRKFTPEEIMRYMKKNLPFGDLLDDYTQVLKDVPAEDVQDQVWEYLLPKYHSMLERYKQYPLCFISNDKRVASASLEPVAFSGKRFHPQLSVTREGEDYLVSLNWQVDNNYVPFENAKVLNSALLLHDYTLYSVGNLNELHLISEFLPSGDIRVAAEDWQPFLDSKLMKWSSYVYVNFEETLIERIDKLTPAYRLYLREKEHVLIMEPAFNYNGVEIKWGFFGDVIEPHNGIVKIIRRNEEAEKHFIDTLRTIHSDIQQNLKDHFFHLPANAVLANNWFFRFTDLMRELDAELFGFEKLKNLRINVHKPDTRVRISSGIDWFDASVELVFGDQSVSIIDVKKALQQKQNFVKLGDGSVGILPEEWLKKYALLVKIGETKGNKIRLKKFHFSVLDELLAEVDEEAVQHELEEKKEKLADIIAATEFGSSAPPQQLKAVLRPYQLAGFHWLQFLNEAGWGGILADDMGLGKTVQALAFFQYYKNENPDAKFLVVCPTTLMYNWENEIKKFTPGLTHMIHHGSKRSATPTVFGAYDIIITTYGTMRSDIKAFREIFFDYVVLDESQSIKNPQSQVARASLLLNCKNRLALSGTPLQNNTFDLYSQMNFLNPGMLGSREFFMNEFATPIDKFQEPEVKDQLKKLTYPFLLRRTKEQVAKDLPEKTETILYCEMGDAQRKIYDGYRNMYRSQILGMIDEKGIERSQMHILQGLTKLRQICDSPAILNEEEKFPNHSVKLDELTREITENVGNHKALIFSQFLGMLALIREKLEKENIPYVYFDGSTSSTDREKAIQEFQKNDDCRVFLISLKAGGIGLNLTAADYVYIVDPWWNPAVEQQAIDRTHRIGQTKNIFAYRLICRETVEEKMLQLQERKRALASELISEDNAMLKKLTREDIAFLFS